VHVARGLLRRLEVDLVVGTGGYASVPAMLAAVTLGIPTALIEPNAQPGRANRLLGRFARLVFVQFDDAVPFFPKGRARLLGFPVRDIPARHDEAARHDVRLLVMGGSQGARAINRALCAGLDRLSACERLRIAHQAGKLDLDEVREAYASAGLDAEIAPFFDDVPRRLASTDLVVSRAGASTIAELRMAGVASVLVPLPLADDHQLANARELERQGACALVRNDEADDRLVDEVLRLAADSAARRAMGEAAAARAEPESAARIWRACAALAEAKA
jgi:UDP-N-acetylglucosamine--N-acetylmuramyl-(pentapeptide) pyrophosphoryl-undecaprenol N-acetylglucosamine transferase